jgi:hypothetical protein
MNETYTEFFNNNHILEEINRNLFINNHQILVIPEIMNPNNIYIIPYKILENNILYIFQKIYFYFYIIINLINFIFN